ncbi:MAG: hypothetical protein H6R16_428 [Proteobacteria bacterium]|nr:hypothetical protein [Pseudomonadota bacterium]
MKFSKSKWLAYTFLVGLLPVLTRLLAWANTTTGMVSPIAASDFVAFGLVLHVSVINELEHLPGKEKEWKTIQNGTSLVFVALYSSLYALTIIGEKNASLIDANVMLRSSMILAMVSTLLSLSVFHRVSKLGSK